MLRRIALALLFAGAVTVAQAESCDTDCHRQCRIRTDFPPVEFIEPTCHAKCEAAKKLACVTRSNVPNIPLTPREQIETYGTQACTGPYQTVTGIVIARCSNWDGRLDDQHLIVQAINTLTSAGIIQLGELNGVQTRWCPLQGAHGMAPDRGRIYLDVSLKGDTLATASTLAHEVVHIRQYRASGTDRFKCDYSRQYVECGGCQDRRNRFEREAYDFESQVSPRIAQFLNQGSWVSIRDGFTPAQSGYPPGYGMQACGCWGFNPPVSAPEPRCASGAVRLNQCPGHCMGGGSPYAYVCG